MWLFFSKCLVEFFKRFKKSRTIEDYFCQVKVDLHITPRRPNMEKCRCIERYRSWSALQAACSFSFRWYDTASSDKGIESPRNGFAHGAYRLYGKKKFFHAKHSHRHQFSAFNERWIFQKTPFLFPYFKSPLSYRRFRRVGSWLQKTEKISDVSSVFEEKKRSNLESKR